MGNPRKVVVIDDEQDIGAFISHGSRTMGFDCISTTDAAEFLRELDSNTKFIFLDLMMPSIDGIELLRLLSVRKCKIPIVLMSGIGSRVLETAEQLALAHGLSIAGHLNKPFRLKELQSLLEAAAPSSHAETTSPQDRAVSDNELRTAIFQDQLELHFQPQITVGTEHVVAVEALVRWMHPTRGLVFPDQFIAAAQELGLIDQLGWHVYAKGMGAIRDFSDAFGAFPVLSVNVDPHSLLDLDFPDRFWDLVEKNGLSGENVKIEITENGLMWDLPKALDVLTRLRLKRISISIDDFGTGYAMMRQLRTVPANELKIDKSFVQNIGRTERDRVLVLKTIELGHDLGMKVVAEGVETEEQSAFLRSNQCDALQGYLFTRPLAKNDLVSWLNDYRFGHPI